MADHLHSVDRQDHISEQRDFGSERSPTRPISSLNIANWFQGQSAPLTLGLIPSPTKESLDPLEQLSPSNSSPESLSSMSFFKSRSKASTGGRFNFLSKLNASPCPAPSPSTPDLTDLGSESGQRDELLAARAKTRCLEVELQNVSVHVANQDRKIKELVTQMARMKDAHRLELAKQQTIRLVSVESRGSEIGQRYPRTRKPRQSSGEVQDSGFESEGYESGFTPAPGSPESPLAGTSSPAIGHPKSRTDEPSVTVRVRSGGGRLFLHDSETDLEEYRGREAEKMETKEKTRVQEAWAVVDVLVEENRGLTSRIRELEHAVEDCLGMVGSNKLSD